VPSADPTIAVTDWALKRWNVNPTYQLKRGETQKPITLMIDGDEYVVIWEDDAKEIHRKTLIFEGVDDSRCPPGLTPAHDSPFALDRSRFSRSRCRLNPPAALGASMDQRVWISRADVALSESIALGGKSRGRDNGKGNLIGDSSG
jgi:hypothetical protein